MPIILRGKVDLQETALIILNVRSELATTEKLLTQNSVPPISCERIAMKYGEREDQSAGKLLVPKLPVETMEGNEQGPSSSRQNYERDEEDYEDRQPEEPMEQDLDQAVDDKASVAGTSSMQFDFLDEDEMKTVVLRQFV